jgi:RimJ/RimL family protein N-acetyltransferase
MTEKITQKNELNPNTKIESERLFMIPSWNADSVELSTQGNNLDTACAVGERFPFPYKVENADEYKKYARQSWESGSEFNFGIYEKETGKYIGNIGFGFKDNINIITNIGYWLGVDFHGKGYGSEAMEAVMNFIKITFPNLKEIHAGAHHYNEGSIKILKKNGFAETGETEEYGILRNGKHAISIKFINKLN